MVVKAELLNSYVGDFRLVDFLGAGGMGEVYRAVNTRTGLVAAVKVLTEATDPRLLERFFNEARIQSSVQHPNIACFYEFHQLGGRPCIVMEYIHGETLAERIRALGRLSTSEALYIFQYAAEAAAYIHKLGIVHRDIKSNNIKLSSSGQVKLLDFGIAKAESTAKMTRTGGVVGTLQYLSPEQLKGGLADARSDLWALGIMLYEMLTGQLPFEAETFGGLFQQIMVASYTPPSTLNPAVPHDVEAIIARCLKKKPADRYQSAQELIGDVSRVAATILTPRPGPAPIPPASSTKRHPGWRLSSAVAAGAVLVTALVIYLASQGPGPATTPGTRPVGTNASNAGAPNAATKTLEVQLTEGVAQVWRDGNLIGTVSASAPLRFPAKVGEKVELIFKQEGYEDLAPARFSVEPYWQDPRIVGTFTMKKR